MPQIKPWKSFVEQLEILKHRGLLVDNKEAALDYLDRIGYYRLSGYWYSFRELELSQNENGIVTHKRLDNFTPGSHFKDAVNLYIFDKKLRLLALDALERIELAIRVDIAYLLGKHDIYAHENAKLFHGNFTKKANKNGNTGHEEWLSRYKQFVHRARREPFVAHYIKKYGKLPIWVAIEILDFGLMSKLYAGMQYKHKQEIAEKYGAKDGSNFIGWLRGLNFIRNVSAHHSRLWNINILERANLPDDPHWQQLNNARPFFYFCLMRKLLMVISPKSKWHQRFSELMNDFPNPDCGTVHLTDFGVIEDWEQWDLWQK